MQFLLGVDAPVSLLLVRQILLTIVLNTLLALPVYLLVRRVVAPFLPDDPRRRRRRAYTTGGLSPISPRYEPPNLEERRPADHAAARGAGGRPRRLRFVLFAIIFFRLWFLQVLSGDDYVTQARENRVRKIKIEAPRGDIVDRDGNRLVRTRVAPVVQIVPSGLPAAELSVADTYRAARSRSRADAPRRRRPAALAGAQPPRGGAPLHPRRAPRAAPAGARVAPRPPGRGAADARRASRSCAQLPPPRPRARALAAHDPPARDRGIAEAPYSNVTVKTDVPRAAFNYLQERKDEFPGVDVEKLFLRSYPHNELGAQLFGTLREISPKELKEKKYRGVAAGTRIGKDGIEETYDRYLRGQDGYTRVVIDALGNRDDRREVTRREPQQGQRLRLTLDLGLQRAANNALKRAIAAASANGNPPRRAPSWRWTRATARCWRSAPTRLRRQRLRQAAIAGDVRRAQLRGQRRAAVQPRDRGRLSDRLDVQADHRDGLAGGGHHHPEQTIFDDGQFKLGAQFPERQGRRVRPARRCSRALQVSSDVFFYTLGERAQLARADHPEVGARSASGTGPASTSRASSTASCPTATGATPASRKYKRCVKREKVPADLGGAQRPAAASSGRGPTGDNVNLAVGQGDLQATPLQMADGLRDDRQRRQGRAPAPRPAGRGRPRPRSSSSSGRRPSAASSSPGRPGDDHGRPAPAPAAERGRHLRGCLRGLAAGAPGLRQDRHRGARPGADQSWYVCYVPRSSRPIVVAVTVEQGGFGAETAAPGGAPDPVQLVRPRARKFEAAAAPRTR